MRVDLRRRNTFMAQHFLYGAQVGAAFYQVRGKTMAKSMRAYVFVYTGF